MKTDTTDTNVENIATVLQTDDERMQIERVKRLIELVNMPLLTFTIQCDQRNGMVTISGLDSNGRSLTFELGHKMLDLGRQALIELEVKAKQKAE